MQPGGGTVGTGKGAEAGAETRGGGGRGRWARGGVSTFSTGGRGAPPGLKISLSAGGVGPAAEAVRQRVREGMRYEVSSVAAVGGAGVTRRRRGGRGRASDFDAPCVVLVSKGAY